MTNGVVYVRFSINGRWALSVSRALRICVWDTMTGAAIGAPLSIRGPEERRVFAVNFPDDEKHLILIVDSEVMALGSWCLLLSPLQTTSLRLVVMVIRKFVPKTGAQVHFLS